MPPIATLPVQPLCDIQSLVIASLNEETNDITRVPILTDQPSPMLINKRTIVLQSSPEIAETNVHRTME
jgi:hypothetical protein